MEQAPLFRCHDCKNRKPKDQFSLRIRDDKCGRRGEPSSRCSACAEKERARREIKKRRDPAEAGRPISIEEFTALLREHALTGEIYHSARVLTQGLASEADEMCAGIVRRVWEATGFRFTYGRSLLEGTMANPPTVQLRYHTKYTRRNGTVQRSYQCCQTTASSNNREKRVKVDKQSRHRARMARFPCNGMIHVTPQNGYFDCVVKHSLDHIRYKDKDLKIPPPKTATA